MKAIIKSIFGCLALLLAFSACSDKNEVMPPTGAPDSAEKLIEGTYVGTWTSDNTNTGEITSSTGYMKFEWNEELGNNVSVLTLVSDDKKAVDLGLKAESCGCNISRNSSGMLSFWNVYELNPFGMVFNGKVSPEGEATLTYTVKKKIRVNGRPVEVKFINSFKGNKQ